MLERDDRPNGSASTRMGHIRGAWRGIGAEGPSLSYDVSIASPDSPGIDEVSRPCSKYCRRSAPIRSATLGDGGTCSLLLHGSEGHGSRHAHPYSAAITRVVNDLITSMAGSISAEHGIGIEKLDRAVALSLRTELDVMRTIKRALDPQEHHESGQGAPSRPRRAPAP